uniref:BED-type domain-containing protein n=1 Tax=Globodera rostochiensis TaxID=31243 RepID=A0A914HSB6_GLORO
MEMARHSSPAFELAYSFIKCSSRIIISSARLRCAVPGCSSDSAPSVRPSNVAQFLTLKWNASCSRNGAGGRGEHRVIRSEVWSRFRLEGLNAICLVCNEKLKVGPTRQTSSLWRHLKRHTRTPPPNQHIPSGYQQAANQQNRLYVQQPQLRRNNFALNGDGIQQQQNAPLSHASRGLTLHRFRLHQQQGHRTTPTTFLYNNFQSHQNQNYRHLLPSSSTSFNHSEASPPCASVQVPFTQPPLVTVDCKPVENRELDQLLGIRREEEEEEEDATGVEEQEFGTFNDRGEEGEEGTNGMIEEEEEEEEEEEMGREWELARTLTDFILENALPFHRLLVLSPTFASLLRLGQSSLPSPAFLLQRMLPKLFADTLEERKLLFNNDFFVLVLNKTMLDSSEQTALLSVTAQKLSDCFALCARPLGQFACDSTSSGMSDALRHCFEEEPVQLRLWQISAIVHDDGADSEELCRQLDVPGIPSIHSLLRRIYAELDSLNFPPECVRRMKERFEEAVGEILHGNSLNPLTDAFSVFVPPLVDRINRFFREQQNAADAVQEEPGENEEKKCESGPVSIHRLEQRLLTKFQLLWAFQRHKLVDSEAARMALFLNPSNLCGAKGADDGEEAFFGESRWHETAERVREQISQACEEGTENVEDAEGDEAKMTMLREDIQSEVSNYMKTARLELGHSTGSNSGPTPSSSSSAPPPSPSHFGSLTELLFWWRINAERFPRLVQLARQFCAVPMSNDEQWKKMSDGDMNADGQTTKRYATELMAKNGDVARLEGGRAERLALLTQLMTVRMAVRERTAHADAIGEDTNE